MINTYEYKTIKFDRKGVFKSKFNPDEELNKLGAEGWKVISSFTAGVGVGSSDEVFYTLMREK
ncbi:DUF4177 domain-containing protein [Cytobacillus purgationiresistens]|uniref:DUF4177 domain-containing protein n=1 Tax=Cytobacillus purgationiresistens TaxID=863449 RepID=A0ABU0AHJ0_9BACI|nr:DUF4177 domain-containing protein [Cytobacillus purgationiresistens]MDQ0270707.1 hypothetical protein [Cytobacillus purgationiresistens]